MKSLTFFLILAVSVSVYAKTEAGLTVAGTILHSGNQNRKIAAADSMADALSALSKFGGKQAPHNGGQTASFIDSGEPSGAYTRADAKAAKAAKAKAAEKSAAEPTSEDNK